jgi:hypothetical protein
MPYSRSSRARSVRESGRHSTTTTLNKALKVIAEATSSREARMAGATATIAEFPQIALPQATSAAMFLPIPSRRQIE